MCSPLFFRLALLLAMFIGMSSEALAVNSYRWLGGTSGNETDWGTSTNWVVSPSTSTFPGNIGGNTDTTLFDSTGITKTIEVGFSGTINPSLDTLTFQDSYTLNIDSSSSLSLSGLSEVQSGNLVLGDIDHPGSYLNGDIQVDAGATLSGFFGNMTGLNNLGTIAPGDANTISELIVQGDFMPAPTSFLRIKIGSETSNDTMLVFGNSILNDSTMVIVPRAGFIVGNPYFIFFSSSFSGAFKLAQPSALDGALSESFGYIVYTINGFTSVIPNGAATYANQQLALAQTANWFGSQLQNRILGYTSPHNPTLWLTIVDGSNKLSNTGNGFKVSPKNVALGLEKSTHDSLCGLSLAYTHINSEGLVAAESANLKGDLYQIGSYGSHDQNNWRLGGHVTLGVTDNMDSQRWIDMGMGYATALSQFQAHSFSAAAQASYLGLSSNKSLSLQPLAGLQYQWLSRNHFMEQGSTGLELNVSHANYHSLRSRLGLALENDFNESVHPFGLAAWEHEFANKAGQVSASIPNVSINFNDLSGTPLNRESFVGKLGLSITKQKIWHLSAFYEGRHTSHYHENAAKLETSYSF